MGKHTLIAKGIAKPATGELKLQGDAQTNLLLAQKTELISELAGAMANQFNNIMMAVSSYAELELKKAASPEKRSLEQVLSNVARATSLIQKLLAFSRKQVPSPQPLQLNHVVTEISHLLQLVAGEQIEIVIALDPDPVAPRLQGPDRRAICIGQTLMRVAIMEAVAERDHGARVVMGDNGGQYRKRCRGIERRQQDAAHREARAFFQVQIGDDKQALIVPVQRAGQIGGERDVRDCDRRCATLSHRLCLRAQCHVTYPMASRTSASAVSASNSSAASP